MNFSIIGLILIVIGWAFQLLYAFQEGKKINKIMLVFYALGLILLVYDSFKNNLTWIALLNLIALILVLAVLFKVSYKKKKGYIHLKEWEILVSQILFLLFP